MNTMQANICLLAVTLCWSCGVVIQAAIPPGVSPFATTCVTSLIGAVLLSGYFFKRIVIAVRRHHGVYFRRVALLGALSAAHNVLALVSLDIASAAFAESMTVAILPVMLVLMRREVAARTWLSATLVLAGIAIGLQPGVGPEQLQALGLVGLGCVFRALYIVKLNDYAKRHDPITLAVGLAFVSAVLSFIPWVITEPRTFMALPWSNRLVATYVIYGFFIVGFATVLNNYAQRRASAAHATVIYSSEIIFTIILAFYLPDALVSGTEVSAPVLVGCLLVVLGNLVELLNHKWLWAEEPTRRIDADVMIKTSHPFRDLIERIKAPALSDVTLFVGLLVLYLVFSLPFKALDVIPGFTDVRPVHMLYPAYGIFFGIPGCLATAVGNLISDILGNDLRWTSIAGFIASFTYPYLLYMFWTRLSKEPFNLRSGKKIAHFAGTLAYCAFVSAFIIVAAVATFYPGVDLLVLSGTIMANMTLFPLVFATPFIILIQEELGYVPWESRLGTGQGKERVERGGKGSGRRK